MSTSATAQGRELIEERRRLDACEAPWLAKLAEFDSLNAWAEDGHATCVSWLVDRCGIARMTAHEKLRVAHQLRRRPVLATAFTAGEISYSKIRTITRIDDADEDLDRSLLDTAQDATVEDLERVVRHWKLCKEQDELPEDRYERRGLRRIKGFGGALDRLVFTGTAEEVDRIMGILHAQIEHDWQAARRNRPVDEFSLKTNDGPVDDPGSGMPTSHPDDPVGATRTQRLADSMVDLFERIADRFQDSIDPERAAIGVTVDYDALVHLTGIGGQLASGVVITGEACRRLACDAGIVRMVTRGVSEILDVGRKTRTWNRAQRRSIRARHGNTCAIRGCDRRVTQIHHVVFWDEDGQTAVTNGIPLCLAHHQLVHDGGWNISYAPTTGIVRLDGPKGQIIESTTRLRIAS